VGLVGNIHLRLVVVRTEVVHIVVDRTAVVGRIVVDRIAVGRIAVVVVGGNHLVVGHIHLLRLWSSAMPGRARVPRTNLALDRGRGHYTDICLGMRDR
jgi:hypothetical protein